MKMLKSRLLATTSLSLALGLGASASLWAKPNPATRPATRPVAKAPAAKDPADKPADRTAPKPPAPPSVSEDKPTTAAELMRQLKEQRERQAKAKVVAHFSLDEGLPEKPSDFSLFGDYRLNLRSLIDRLENVRSDDSVKGVLITLGNASMSLSQAQEVRDAMAAVVRAGKPVFVHADVYDTTLYTLASGASDICVLEGGELMMPGIGIESMFLRGLFDKVGVKADYVQIGEYKGADEQYTRIAASEELRGEMNKLVESLYTEIVDGIAAARKIDKQVVRQSIDDMIISGKVAKARGLVDHLIDQDGVRALMAAKLGGEVSLNTTYGMPKREAVDFSNPFALLASLTKKPDESAADETKPAVAIVYAEGVIVDGETSESFFGGGGEIGSENLRQAFRIAARDKNVKAVVIRIDSPGGSALASEVMWQSARRLAKEKPVIISIGGMAASGGYYLASAGETIYADPTAVVGSIGVVGGKFVLKDLFEKLGVKTETFARGRNAGLFSMNEPFTDRQRVMVTTWMKQTYDQFTERVMTTRKGKIKDIDAVARGRIFVARQAKELGMVDEIGGIHSAIAAAAGKAGLKTGAYDVKQVPAPKTLGDMLSGGNGEEAAARTMLPIRPTIEFRMDSLFAQLSPELQRQMASHIRLSQLLQKRPVVLISPYTVTVK